MNIIWMRWLTLQVRTITRENSETDMTYLRQIQQNKTKHNLPKGLQSKDGGIRYRRHMKKDNIC